MANRQKITAHNRPVYATGAAAPLAALPTEAMLRKPLSGLAKPHIPPERYAKRDLKFTVKWLKSDKEYADTMKMVFLCTEGVIQETELHLLQNIQ
jgi:hypothetical protein